VGDIPGVHDRVVVTIRSTTHINLSGVGTAHSIGSSTWVQPSSIFMLASLEYLSFEKIGNGRDERCVSCGVDCWVGNTAIDDLEEWLVGFVDCSYGSGWDCFWES
jgi:hypothetical protein